VNASIRLQVGATLASLVLISLLVMRVSAAAFTATTDNPQNSWDTGSITLTDDDGGGAGSAMFNVSGMLPGQTEVRCITVTYTGAADPAAVKLYVAVTDGGLGAHLDVEVSQVTETGGSGNACGTVSGPTGIVATQTLNAFGTAHSGYSNGAGTWDPTGTAQTQSYQFTVTLGADTPDSAQGSDAQATFTWETTT